MHYLLQGCWHPSTDDMVIMSQGNQSCGAGFDSALVSPTAILTPPMIEVSQDGFHLVIELEDLGPQFQFLVAYWRREPDTKVRLPTLAHESGFGKEAQLFVGESDVALEVHSVWVT